MVLGDAGRASAVDNLGHVFQFHAMKFNQSVGLLEVSRYKFYRPLCVLYLFVRSVYAFTCSVRKSLGHSRLFSYQIMSLKKRRETK